MTAWHKLVPEEAHLHYKVPVDIAVVAENDFYSVLQPEIELTYDGPVSLLVFQQQQEDPAVITFQICHIETEALAFEAFNPLTDEGGFLYLNKQEGTALVDLLLKYADTVQPRYSSRSPVFELLDPSKLTAFGFQGKSASDNRQEFYYQVYDPLADQEQCSSVTILTFSTGWSQPDSYLFFSIAQFPLQSLQNPSFDPEDKSFARINLDRGGLAELASLLQAQLGHLADTI